MLVVMPFGYGNKELIGLGWELIRAPEADRPWQDSFTKFRASLFDELMPQVEKAYRVSSSAGGRAIAGLSMGGSQSLFIGLNAPERFAWIGAFSSGGLKPDIDAQFPDAAEKAKSQLRLLWIGCGTDDRLIEINRKLVGWLKEKGIAHTWVEKPGGHSFLVWRRFLAEFAPLLFQDARNSRD
jgi:enterochelin esterase-like enzyme